LRDLTERDVGLAIEQGFKANIQPRAMTTYCGSGCNSVGTCVCTLTRGDGRFGTGLRVELAVGEDANARGRWFCPEATRRAICSWLCLSCSAMLAICFVACLKLLGEVRVVASHFLRRFEMLG
jgi:hypothetical protein